MVPPKPSSYTDFPPSKMTADGIQSLTADFSNPISDLFVSVEYAHKSGLPLHLHILEPDILEGGPARYPLIVYIVGSAWFKQQTARVVPQLSHFARLGYVIAIVEYRPSNLAPFPAQIQDTKTALRFMLEHADRYHVDSHKIVLWGGSSGGHTAVMTGLTINRPELDDRFEANQQINVRAVVDFYGPTDISKMNDEPSTMDHVDPDSPEGMLIGGRNVLENPDHVHPTNPMNYISAERQTPPFLIVHGDKDRLVPFGQSVMLYEALKAADKSVEMYRLAGADHGGRPFWSAEVIQIVEHFLRASLS